MARAPIRSAAGVSRSLLRAAITTSAPSCLASSAVARPIPEEPPTTTTVFPSSSITHPSDRSLKLLRLRPLQRSARLIAHADARFALAKSGQFPDAGAGRIDVGGDVDIDQIRP